MKFNLEIAEFTRSMQSQNGLRHGDYHRYRHFCTRKLHRLRSSLKIPNGRHRFKKAVFPESINSVRFLQVLAVQAERAWAHALTLKSEFAIGEAKALGRVRHRYIRKFYKAARTAGELLDLARKSCDVQTVLEAEAYFHWLHGLALTEDGEYEKAMESLTVSAAAYTELSKSSLDVIFPTASRAYKHRIADMEPIMRVCRYKLRLSQAAQPEMMDEVSPRSAAPEDFESANEMSEADFSSDSDMADEDDAAFKPVEGKPATLLGKIGGWWNKN